MSGARALPALTSGTRPGGARSRALTIAKRAVLRLVTHVLPLLLVIVIGTFCLIHAAPGSPLEILSAEMQLTDQAMIDRLGETYGLDQPVHVQLYRYLVSVAQLDLGFSYRQNQPVLDAVLSHLPATLLLMLSSMAVAVLTGVLSGVIAATNANRPIDRLLSMIAVFLFAAPAFWLGIMLIVLFSVHLGWLPIGDMRTIGADYGAIGNTLDLLHHLALPALALGLHQAAIYLRVTRTAMLDIVDADFVRTARAKGLRNATIIYRHIFRNALLPIVTVMGLQFASVMSGSVVVEAVFNWPGIGSLLYDAVVARDYPIVLGVIILGSLVVIAVNLLIDLVYTWLDPRIEIN